MNAAMMKQPSPVVQRRGAAWDGIRLEHYRFRAGDLAEHSNAEHLVTVSMGGGCKAEIRTASGFRTRDKARGSVCVIPSGAPFTTRIDEESEYLAIYLDPSLVLRAAAESRAARGTFEVVESCAASDPVVRGVGLALLAEMEGEHLGGRLYAESLANVLAVHLLRRYTNAAGEALRFAGGLGGQRLRQVKDFIAASYGDDISLDDLARVAGMSTFHFAREFKRTTGTTPHQYLIKYRVERAKALLVKEGDMPLVEVGAQSGFSHQSHFTRLFRRLTGTTPQVYRLMFQH